MLGVVWDAVEVGSECSCDIVTRTKPRTMVTKSSNNTCNLLGWYASRDIRSKPENVKCILRSPTKSSMIDGPFAAPKRV